MPPLTEIEAGNCQCVDVVLCTLLTAFFLSCSHRRANTGLNDVVCVSNHTQDKNGAEDRDW